MAAYVRIDNRAGAYKFAGPSLAQIDAWCVNHFGKDVLHFAQTLTVRFHSADVIFRVVSGDRLLVRARMFQAGIHVADRAFRLIPTTRQAHHSWFVVRPVARSGVASKPLSQNLHLIERDCGILSMTLNAALTHGGYVWAMHGYLPVSDSEWQRLAALLRRKLSAISGALPPATLAATHKLLAFPGRIALRGIAAANAPVAGTTLGKYLLMGESWDGVLELLDSTSATMFIKRIGLVP